MSLAMDSERVPRIRSALFVPGNRQDFLNKADQCGADALIVDLEDAVPIGSKDQARGITREWLMTQNQSNGPKVCVRINPLAADLLADDLEAVIQERLLAVVVPKVSSAAEIVEISEALSYYEGRGNLQHGQILIWPLIENAAAIQIADEIARSSPRIAYMGGATSEEGDVANNIGFRGPPQGAATLYIRSKILVDARAADIPNPITGLVTRLSLADVQSFAAHSRDLGYDGMMVIHPSHVAIVNEVFTRSAKELEEARGILKALEEARSRGQAAVEFRGRLIDAAMAHAAARFLKDADVLEEGQVGDS